MLLLDLAISNCECAVKSETIKMIEIDIAHFHMRDGAILEVVCYVNPQELQEKAITEKDVQTTVTILFECSLQESLNGIADLLGIEDKGGELLISERLAKTRLLEKPGMKELLRIGVFGEIRGVHEGKKTSFARVIFQFPSDTSQKHTTPKETKPLRERN